ncbi:receptor-like protein 9DC1 isoform X2 [Lycium ferocissimum]|uniref:receptor-like protein 9DC1 isoform X2 n=1 Tax=Lycium ferocissimum TaxID=112874 RepID=UPI0028159773|nr:receptor-like protein 9DC1 isoform X2 [Lycium ferocissimum]
MGYGIFALFLLYIAFLCQLVFSSSLPHLCPNDQALALLQFKHMFTINSNASNFCIDSINGQINSYPKTLSWNKSTDCCSWDGVYCEETTGQVIELNLTCSQLQGKFHSNSSLFQLSNLKRLDLSYNDFYGSLISPKFGEFSSLTHLDLSGLDFTGLIPSEISHLSKLYVLRIWNFFTHELRIEPHNFELLLKNLTQLRELNLNFVNISSTIPLNFSSFLTTLCLSDTQLFGILPERVFHLSNLEYLDLSPNPQLTVWFPTTKWNSSISLMYLYLGEVNFTGEIPDSFSYLTSLQRLIMISSNLTGPFPKPIWNLTSIKCVELKHNQLQGPIPKSLLNQQSLEYLLLSQNNLSGKIDSTICNLKTVKVLDLGSNNLKGTIPQCLGEMSELETFDLRNNSLSGTINTTFRFGNRLIGFNLRRNKLEGEVPRSLINCKHLEVVDLGNNELNDTFPKWLGTLPNLEILSLRSNKFHGHIKYSKNKNLFVQLRILDLSSNEFSGNLSACLFENFHAMKIIVENTQGYAQELYYSLTITTKGLDLNFVRALMSPNIVINLSRNRFEGHIPRIIGDLVGLRSLNLSHNDLEGHIPASLQQLSVLESLDLSSNKIGGEIPQQLASLTSLEVLNLSHNHLVGCIPRGKQFNTFDYSSYQGNVGLRGFPLSRDCGGDDGATQVTTPIELDQEEEGDSAMISWQAVLMGYGCGLIVVLSIIYIMLATQNPAWFSRMVEELEHRIITRMQKHKKRN